MIATQTTTVQPEYNSRAGAYHIYHRPRNPWPVSTTIVLGISSLTDTDPTSMLPLYGAADPDVLERHVTDVRDRDVELTFKFHGYGVTVHSDGHIEFAPLDDREAVLGEDTDRERR